VLKNAPHSPKCMYMSELYGASLFVKHGEKTSDFVPRPKVYVLIAS